jgi:hypothetical protein
MCLAVDHASSQNYYGRHVVDGKVFVRTQSVFGVHMPMTCSFDRAAGTIQLHRNLLTSKNASVESCKSRYFEDAAKDLGVQITKSG